MKSRPAVPPTRRPAPDHPSECVRCFPKLLLAEERAALDADGPGYDRAAAKQRALETARLVSWRGGWRCPRCTLVSLDDDGKERVPLGEALPNHAARRWSDKAYLRDLRKG